MRRAPGPRPRGTGRRSGPRARQDLRASTTKPAASTSRRFRRAQKWLKYIVHAQPVVLDPARVVLDAHRRDEHAARPQPARGSGRRAAARRPVARASGSRTRRPRRRTPAANATAVMSAWRNVAPGTFARAQPDLRRRDVDPGHVPAVGERRGHRDAGAAAQLEDLGTGRDQIARPAQVQGRAGASDGRSALHSR